MNHPSPPFSIGKCLTAVICLAPSLALAHPGHFHPGEEDEFDALLSNFLHLHGYLEFGLAALALAAAVLFFTNRNRPVRLAAAIPAADRSQASPRSE